MAAWQDVVNSDPDFSQRVRAIMDAHRHKTIATLRADGAPRISGIEASFASGELLFGSMPGSRKAADLRRDPRFALHSASVDPPEGDESHWQGDAKINGRAVPITDPEQVTAALRAMGVTEGVTEGVPDPDNESHQGIELFRADITDVVLTRVGEPADHLVIELWRPGQPLRRMRRA